MSSTTKPRSDRGMDFYRTPAWCVAAIAPHLPKVLALDPCCGDGAILESLRTNGWERARGIESDEGRWMAAHSAGLDASLCDALTVNWSDPPLVVMNPPFNKAEEFVRRALVETRPTRGTVAALLRLAFLESKSRASFHSAHPSDVYVMSKRPSFTGGKTDSCAYAWFVWGPGRGGRWFVL